MAAPVAGCRFLEAWLPMRSLPTTPIVAPLFVFGTLLDADLRRIVLGAHDRPPLMAARLRGYARRTVCGETFPMLVPAPGAVVDGLLIAGLGPQALARLRFYEGPGYALRPLSVHGAHGERRRCRARVFLATQRLRESGQPWSLQAWQQSDKALALVQTRQLMALYGRTGADGPPEETWEDIKRRSCAADDAGAPAVSEAFAS